MSSFFIPYDVKTVLFTAAEAFSAFVFSHILDHSKLFGAY